jgi:hypothetical protein
VQAVLTDDLILPKYRGGKHELDGHCYAATEAYFYLEGRDRQRLRPMHLAEKGMSHWWLEQADGTIIDLTGADGDVDVKTEVQTGRGRDRVDLQLEAFNGRGGPEARVWIEAKVTAELMAAVEAEDGDGEQATLQPRIDRPRARRAKALTGSAPWASGAPPRSYAHAHDAGVRRVSREDHAGDRGRLGSHRGLAHRATGMAASPDERLGSCFSSLRAGVGRHLRCAWRIFDALGGSLGARARRSPTIF